MVSGWLRPNSWNHTRSDELHFHATPSASTAVSYTPGHGEHQPIQLSFWPVFLYHFSYRGRSWLSAGCRNLMYRRITFHVELYPNAAYNRVICFSCSFCVPNARRSWAPLAGGVSSALAAAGWLLPSRFTRAEWMKWEHCRLVTSSLPKPELIAALDGLLNNPRNAG